MFTRKEGESINPSYATTRFRILTDHAGLPPVRLHDLRHGAASLAHEAGADLKTPQDLRGHSSIVVTADTYTTSVLPDSQRRCAEATAALVLAAAQHTRQRIKEKAAKNRPTGRAEKETPSEKRPTSKQRSRRSRVRRPARRHGK